MKKDIVEENDNEQKLLDYTLSGLENVNQISDCLNVAIIGESGSGKSSFLTLLETYQIKMRTQPQLPHILMELF